MALLILSFIAGVLTVAAPCVLPLLPVIVGGSILESGHDKPERQWLRPLIIAGSLAASVIIFTLLIKATTALLGVPALVWQIISGLIVIALGVNYLWPQVWEKVSIGSGLLSRTQANLSQAGRRRGPLGAALIGAALGPVFNSCSPTYALIVAVILPASFASGFINLVAYALGMSATLLLIAYLGQSFAIRLRWLANPGSPFKKVIGAIFIAVGLAVILGLDKQAQAFVLEQGWYDPISDIEHQLSN